MITPSGDRGKMISTDKQGDLMPLFDGVDTDFEKDKLTPELAESLRNFMVNKIPSR